MTRRLLALKTGLATLLAALPAAALAGELEVIYGDDNRRDLFSPDNDPAMVELARSTAMLTYAARLTPDEDAGFSRLPGETFGAAYNLCSSEPFRDQPNPAFCSGFLVGEDILVTAGHCVETQSACDETAFVFGFGYETEERDVTRIDNRDVYRCKRLVAQELRSGTQSDYAVVQLDRKVEGRQALKFRKEGRVEVGAPLTVIGHPAGLPTKIAGGANVRTSSAAAYFVANLDTYGGNSGSAVFNTATHEVEGILVRGENDFTSRGGCRISNVCTNNSCRGEDVTRATEFAPFVPDPSQPTRPTQAFEHPVTGLDVVIPDANQTGISQSIRVDEEGLLADVSVHVVIEHPYVGDLVVTLVHPDGTRAVLHRNTGGGQNDLDQVYGDGGLAVSDLTRLRGKPARGTWKLEVKDTGASDQGKLKAVTLTTKVFVD